MKFCAKRNNARLIFGMTTEIAGMQLAINRFNAQNTATSANHGGLYAISFAYKCAIMSPFDGQWQITGGHGTKQSQILTRLSGSLFEGKGYDARQNLNKNLIN